MSVTAPPTIRVAVTPLDIPIVGAAALGPPGPTGPAGPPGPGGAGAFYNHNQGVPAASWVIVHNLSKPLTAITVVDSAGSQIIPDVTFDSPNQLTVTFAGAMSGQAYLV